jgi:hypothetical protein
MIHLMKFTRSFVLPLLSFFATQTNAYSLKYEIMQTHAQMRDAKSFKIQLTAASEDGQWSAGCFQVHDRDPLKLCFWK